MNMLKGSRVSNLAALGVSWQEQILHFCFPSIFSRETLIKPHITHKWLGTIGYMFITSCLDDKIKKIYKHQDNLQI